MKPSLNWLLVFIPITLILEHVAVPLPALFFSAALALIPIAGLWSARIPFTRQFAVT